MLTDIFARRYENRPLFNSVGPREQAFFFQAYRIIDDQVFPYYGPDKKVDVSAKAAWTSLHDRLTMELGIEELSPRYYTYQTTSDWYDMNLVCKAWLTKTYTENLDADVFIKHRLSFVELAFREKEQKNNLRNISLEFDLIEASRRDAAAEMRQFHIGMTVPRTQSSADHVRQKNQFLNTYFQTNVNELNERLKQAGMPLNYHSGFIQINTDALTQSQIERPFWEVLKEPKWNNVSTDMAEALNLRDTGGADPAMYAARAFESTIKIICDTKQWTTGNEKGAANFLDHLSKKVNGPFIEHWERELITAFFSHVRNAIGHGAGSGTILKMTEQQSDQIIEFCMSWIKSLIKRL